jgi:hypothetical protein
VVVKVRFFARKNPSQSAADVHFCSHNLAFMNRLVLAVAIELLVWSVASAQTRNPSLPLTVVEPGSMSADGTTGLFRLPGADVIPDRYRSIAVFADNSDWNPGDVDSTQFGISAAYGVGNSVEIFARFNLSSRLDIDQSVAQGTSTATTGVLSTTDAFPTGVGDSRVGVKWQFAHRITRAAVLAGVILPSPATSVGADRVNICAGVAVQRTLSPAEVYISSTGTFPLAGDGASELRMSAGVEVRRDLRWRPQLEIDVIKVSGSRTDVPLRADLLAGPVLTLTHDTAIRPALAWNLARGLDGIGYQMMLYWHPGRVCP